MNILKEKRKIKPPPPIMIYTEYDPVAYAKPFRCIDLISTKDQTCNRLLLVQDMRKNTISETSYISISTTSLQELWTLYSGVLPEASINRSFEHMPLRPVTDPGRVTEESGYSRVEKDVNGNDAFWSLLNEYLAKLSTRDLKKIDIIRVMIAADYFPTNYSTDCSNEVYVPPDKLTSFSRNHGAHLAAWLVEYSPYLSKTNIHIEYISTYRGPPVSRECALQFVRHVVTDSSDAVVLDAELHKRKPTTEWEGYSRVQRAAFMVVRNGYRAEDYDVS